MSALLTGMAEALIGILSASGKQMKAYFLSCNALSAGIISAKPGRECSRLFETTNSAFVSSPTPSPLTSDDLRHRALPAALVDNQITSKWCTWETFEDKELAEKELSNLLLRFDPATFRLTTLLTHERNDSPF